MSSSSYRVYLMDIGHLIPLSIQARSDTQYSLGPQAGRRLAAHTRGKKNTCQPDWNGPG